MNNTVNKTIEFVKKELEFAEGGHDWWHIYRVWKNAKTIAQKENANLLIVELAALLHDIADSKFNSGDEEIGPEKAGKFLIEIGLNNEITNTVVSIIKNVSYKGGKEKGTFSSIELDIVRDADRLDAIGAIGIARAFNYGGYKNRAIYNPEIKPNLNMTKEEYKNSSAPTINHFYEKLLLLKDGFVTATAKEIASNRHKFMEQYLEQFYSEFEGLK
jgi:uncharacterized protein